MPRVLFIVTVFLLATCICLTPDVRGELIKGPRDEEVVRGSNISLTCITSLAPHHYVNWFHIPTGTNTRTEVYYNELNIIPYHPRFRVSKDKVKGEFNLTVSSVDFSDSGTYICVDESGSGTERRAELVVLDSVPNVKANISLDNLTICEKGVHVIGLTCDVSYKGNISPILGWEKVTPGGTVISYAHNGTVSEASSSAVKSTTAVVVDYTFDRFSFICHTTTTMVKSISTTLHLKYVVSNGSEMQYDNDSFCQVKTNVPCRIRLRKLKDENLKSSGQDSSSNSTRPSTFNCEYTCNLGEEICQFSEPFYGIEETASSDGSCYQTLFIILAVVIGLLIVVVALGVVFYKKRKHFKRFSNKTGRTNDTKTNIEEQSLNNNPQAEPRQEKT